MLWAAGTPGPPACQAQPSRARRLPRKPWPNALEGACFLLPAGYWTFEVRPVCCAASAATGGVEVWLGAGWLCVDARSGPLSSWAGRTGVLAWSCLVLGLGQHERRVQRADRPPVPGRRLSRVCAGVLAEACAPAASGGGPAEGGPPAGGVRPPRRPWPSARRAPPHTVLPRSCCRRPGLGALLGATPHTVSVRRWQQGWHAMATAEGDSLSQAALVQPSGAVPRRPSAPS